ncbi:zinc metalloprotease [Altererythrobacter salegens]|uniref:Zinc metalloprotease n=1 Tax=Croceibacterium salegens TaxID=1737568 RepID=A0A6I4SRP6_9SPHN|nr:M12 family metallopeptidase [Croceibacterium salegens]MXO58485.1 zinc metalloprotease [Croceibacterium salegens]
MTDQSDDAAYEPADESLDLPAAMFRHDGPKHRVDTDIYTLKDGVRNFTAAYVELGGQAIFEGDIVLGSQEQVARARAQSQVFTRGVTITGSQFRWPSGAVPYQSQGVVRDTAEKAIAHWMQRTPLKFVARTDEADFISFERRDGCWSAVGRQGGKQVISLGEGCSVGSAIHEIGHALGLWHEQSREDRDNYITLVPENIIPNMAFNFEKHVQDGDDRGVYDYGSIMHYPEKAFSANGKATIVTKTGASIGQRNGLSAGDVAAIKAIYAGLDWSGFA